MVFKHGASLYKEAELFSLPITNPKGRPMLPFDWLILSDLILARIDFLALPQKFWRSKIECVRLEEISALKQQERWLQAKN